MTSAGVGKTALAFIVGVALALGGVRLYTHLAPHPNDTEEATATVPAVPDGFQRLPDDDAPPAKPAPALSPAAPSQPEPAPLATPTPPQRKTVPLHSSVQHPQAARPRTEVLKARAAASGFHPASAHATHPVLPRPNNPPLLLASNTPPRTAANPGSVAENSAAENAADPNLQPAPPGNASNDNTPEPSVTTAPAPVAPSEPVPAPRQPRTVTIPAGTLLNIRLNQGLSSDHNFAGDTFQGTLESPIILDNALVAERGSKVTGKVVNVRRGGRADSGSDLSLTLTHINTTDSQRVPVETSIFNQQTNRNTGRDAAKVGGGAALGALIGAIAGGGAGAAIGAGVGGAAGVGDVVFTHGRPAVLQPEAQISFRLSAAVAITERIDN